jgi:hypothetical protein
MIESAYRFESTGKAEEYTCVRLYLSLLYLMHACLLYSTIDNLSAVITEGCMLNVALVPVTPYVYRKVNTYTYNIVRDWITVFTAVSSTSIRKYNTALPTQELNNRKCPLETTTNSNT